MDTRKIRFFFAAIFVLSMALGGCVPEGEVRRTPPQVSQDSPFERGKALYEKGNYDAALTAFTEASKADPTHWLNYNWMGWSYYRLGKYQEGIAQFRISNSLQQSGDNYHGLAESYAALKDYSAALESLKKYAEMDPKNFLPYNRMGWTYFRLKQYEEAVVQFRISNTVKEVVGNYEGLGSSFCELGQFDKADDAFSGAAKIAANDQEKNGVDMAWAFCRLAQGDYDKAYRIIGPRPFLGLRIAAAEDGIKVEDVIKGGPASLAGLKPGDVLTGYHGQELKGISVERFLKEVVGKTAFGAQVPVKAKRGAGVFETTVQAGITPQLAAMKAAPAREVSAPAVEAQKQGMRWAVVVGISEYQDSKVPALRYAASDARAFYDWIVSPEGGRYAPANVKLLIDKEATGRNIKAALFEWLKAALEEDMVVIYFAGHGSPESPDSPNNLYLLPFDTQYDSIATTGFPMWDIETALKRFIRAQKVVVIADACHSGGVGQSFDVARRASRAVAVNPISAGIQGLSQTGDGICVISASGENQFSQESREWGGGHGVFTYFLLKGLKGEADYNKNVSVSLGELTSYLSEQVRRETKNAQSPTVAGRYDPSLTIGK